MITCTSFVLWLLLPLLILGASSVPAFAAPATLDQEQPLPPNTPDIPHPFIQQVIDLSNAHRAAVGCPPLVANPLLNQTAQHYSEDMAIRNFFSHTSPEGLQFTDRMAMHGYGYSSGGENIAAGLATPEAVVGTWINSPGHRENILNCAFAEVGVGYAFQADDQADVRFDDGVLRGPFRHYWTQVFAVPAPR